MHKLGVLLIILMLVLPVVSELFFPRAHSSNQDIQSFDNSLKRGARNPLDGIEFPRNVTSRYDVSTIAELEHLTLFTNSIEEKSVTSAGRYIDDSTREFGEKLRQKVSTQVPLILSYDETKRQNETVASPQLLSSVWLYKATGNKTYLKYATETAGWLNQPREKKFLIFWYNTTNGKKANLSTSGFEIEALIALTENNRRFLGLANWALNEFHRIFVPRTNLSYISVNYDGTPNTAYSDLGSQARLIALFSHAYWVTKNTTYSQWAEDLTEAFWSRKSDINITPGYLDQNGTAKYNYVKEDQHAGTFLLALETAYGYTKDEYYRQIIKTYANAVSTYFWNPSLGRFVYRINWQTGTTAWPASVHGFSVLDMGLVNAYLLTGYETFLERAQSDYDELVVNGHILKNGLIVHAIDNHNRIINPQSNWEWNKHAFPAGLMFYILTHDKAYLHALDQLYASLGHHWKTHGYVSDIDAFSFAPLSSSIFLVEYNPVLNAMLQLSKQLHINDHKEKDFSSPLQESTVPQQYANLILNSSTGFGGNERTKTKKGQTVITTLRLIL